MVTKERDQDTKEEPARSGEQTRQGRTHLLELCCPPGLGFANALGATELDPEDEQEP